jgi:hypothetical protein
MGVWAIAMTMSEQSNEAYKLEQSCSDFSCDLQIKN